ncbi:Aste57867_13176 [Aphanomyces stellatus]|uniref:Aste57867_13176 protein n=1 Tax=Aphanomyces stellatus TaxID=120398 RepID=A0A485KXF5_9STRA|nr:hypothetical protein As57867_013127 [Aphanomyces stellatus]VFT90017.1 Aste57867_13176 [Aphanomyces stellatus]
MRTGATTAPGDLNSVFFTCHATPGACATADVTAFLKRCGGKPEQMAFNPAEVSVCCDVNSVRECIYMRPGEWTAKRISVVPVPGGTSKPMYTLTNWNAYAWVELMYVCTTTSSIFIVWLSDITRVSLKAVETTSFNYTNVKKLTIVDADLESIQTPPSPALNILDLSKNNLHVFPTYLFNATHSTIESVLLPPPVFAHTVSRQLNIFANPWAAAIPVDATQCTKLKAAADGGHITGIYVNCTCTATTSTCAVPPSIPSTTTSSANNSTANATTTTRLPTTQSSATTPPTDTRATVHDETSGGTPTGTILVIIMAVAVIGLAALAVLLYRRRRHIQRNPHAPTGFEVAAISSRSLPFTRPLVLTSGNKTQLLRKTSSLSSSTTTTTYPTTGLWAAKGVGGGPAPSRHRVDQLPILPAESAKLLRLLSGSLFSGKYNGENVVMKRLDAREVNEDEVANFIADVNVIGQLEHPHVLLLYGVVKFSDYEVCAVAEFMHCGTLPHVLLKQEIALSWPDMLRMCFEVASALAYVHSQPNYTRATCLTSRDVLVNVSLTCKLNIFDFMKRFERTKVPDVTYGGASLAWEAPEVLSHNCSRSSTAEIYSLGVIFGEIVTRARPYATWTRELGFVGADHQIMRRTKASKDMPHENRPEFASCPRFFRHLVAACLERDVLRRPLAVSVAETLHHEMTLLSRNYG